MIFRITRFVCGCTLGLVALGGWALQPARAEPPPEPTDNKTIVIFLRPAAEVASGEVRLADVAILDGGSRETRSRIGGLDLADTPQIGQTVHLSREQVAYRLQLAGFDPTTFQLRGSRTAIVTLSNCEVAARDIVDAARQCVIERLSADPENVSIRLAQSIQGPIKVPGSPADIRLEPAIRSSQAALGRVRVDIAILRKDERQLEVPVYLDVRLFQKVAIAIRRIERGQALTDENTRFELRAMDGSGEYLNKSAELGGKRAKRTILPMQLITAADIEAVGEESPVLVKQRDAVTLVIQKAGLRIVASGEATQDGRAGQMIRVRNTDSKNIVLGRVVDRSVVEVRF